ncbi:hypothetical protein [Cellulomonas sp. P5_C6]
MIAPARRALVTAVAAATLALGSLAVAAPSVAADSPVVADPTLPRAALSAGGVVQPQATIEGEEAFCAWLTGVYVNHPTYYTVRVYNCRYTDVFVKGTYLNGTFGTCVLVPARHSRHLGGSVVKPLDDAQVC